MFVRPKKLIRTSGTEALGYVDIRTLAEGMCRYDLNEQDVAWLQMANEQFAEMGESRAGLDVSFGDSLDSGAAVMPEVSCFSSCASSG